MFTHGTVVISPFHNHQLRDTVRGFLQTSNMKGWDVCILITMDE